MSRKRADRPGRRERLEAKLLKRRAPPQQSRQSGLSEALQPIYPKTRGQEDLFEAINTNRITICDGPAGTGKAQPLDALVLTPSGYKEMGDIRLGDLVSTPDGESAKVIGVFPQGTIEVFKVSFSDGTSTECCGDHLWLTQTALDRDTRRVGSIKAVHEIAASLITKTGKRNHSIPMTQPVEFDYVDLPIDPYALGVLLGDGTLCGPNVILTTADSQVLETVGASTFGVPIKKCRGSTYDYRISGSRKGPSIKNPLKESLKLLGVLGKRSHEKNVPLSYKYASPAQRLALLQGLMDTDGTIQTRGNTCDVSFTSTSECLAEDVRYLVESLGGKASIRSRVTSYPVQGREEARQTFLYRQRIHDAKSFQIGA